MNLTPLALYNMFPYYPRKSYLHLRLDLLIFIRFLVKLIIIFRSILYMKSNLRSTLYIYIGYLVIKAKQLCVGFISSCSSFSFNVKDVCISNLWNSGYWQNIFLLKTSPPHLTFPIKSDFRCVYFTLNYKKRSFLTVNFRLRTWTQFGTWNMLNHDDSSTIFPDHTRLSRRYIAWVRGFLELYKTRCRKGVEKRNNTPVNQ